MPTITTKKTPINPYPYKAMAWLPAEEGPAHVYFYDPCSRPPQFYQVIPVELVAKNAPGLLHNEPIRLPEPEDPVNICADSTQSAPAQKIAVPRI